MQQSDDQPQPTSKGPQGVDKAPGEDPGGEPGEDLKNSQKGKKVDADLTEEKDRPSNPND
jgi:hypothetical protein